MKKKLILFFLLLPIFWVFWLPGPRVATDYHVTTKNIQDENLSFFIWKETNVGDGLGEYTGTTLWSQPIHFIFAFLYKIPLPLWFVTKIVVALIFYLSFFSILKLLEFLKITGIAKFAGAYFYLLNSFILLLIDGGQLSLAFAYSIFPLATFFFLSLLDNHSMKTKLYLALSVLGISIFDIRFLLIIFLIFLIYFLFRIIFTESKKEKFLIIRESLISAFVSIIIILGFHSYWIIPSLTFKAPKLPQTYERVSQIDLLSFSSILHSIMLQQPHWFKNVFGNISNPSFEFLLIPFLVFSTIFLIRKNVFIGFWLTIAMLGIFLTKGSREPLGYIYSFLFTNVPGFSLFRDPSKFYFLTALAYSVLISFTAQALVKLRNRKLGKVLAIFMIIYFVILTEPVFLGQMTGLFSFPVFEKEFKTLNNILETDSNFSRVFWIPTTGSLAYVSSVHPAIEASRFVQKRPFAVGVRGSYEEFNFIREAPYMSEIFDVSAVGYIAYPFLDYRRANLDPDNIRYYDLFSKQIESLAWVSRLSYSPIPLYKLKNHQDRFFLTPNVWAVIGSDDIYSEATKSSNLRLSNNALIFVEEHPALGRVIEELPQAKIVLNNKGQIDIAASLIDSKNLIFPAKQLNFEPNDSGWWKREAADVVRWRDFLQTKYKIDNQDFDLDGGWAVSEGSLELKIQNLQLEKDDILLARVLESSRSGNLKFYEDNEAIGNITTSINKNTNVKWHEVGSLPKDGNSLTIKSEGDINVVNALSLAHKDKWELYKTKVQEFIEAGRVISFDKENTQDDSSKLTYRRINPTKYIVTISNLKIPQVLVFSENFDGLWKMNGLKSFPVYSLLNGFSITHDGIYTVEYEAQGSVYKGLIVTIVTLLIIAVFLFKLNK